MLKLLNSETFRGLDEDGLPGRRLVPSVGGELHAARAEREKSQEGLHRSASVCRGWAAFEPARACGFGWAANWQHFPEVLHL